MNLESVSDELASAIRQYKRVANIPNISKNELMEAGFNLLRAAQTTELHLGSIERSIKTALAARNDHWNKFNKLVKDTPGADEMWQDLLFFLKLEND